jgi:hypothetical protein
LKAEAGRRGRSGRFRVAVLRDRRAMMSVFSVRVGARREQ